MTDKIWKICRWDSFW